MLGIVLISIQGMYVYKCYFHIKINFNIPEYLITPSLPPHLCSRIRIEEFDGMERYIMEG